VKPTTIRPVDRRIVSVESLEVQEEATERLEICGDRLYKRTDPRRRRVAK
jgi:hypothetical protein